MKPLVPRVQEAKDSRVAGRYPSSARYASAAGRLPEGPGRGVEEFSAYVAERAPALLRAACAITRDAAEAEDLLQTALAKTYQYWDRIEHRQAVDSYVRRVLLTTYATWYRRRRVPELLTDEPPEPAGPVVDGTDGWADRHADRQVLWAAVRRLPERQRAMVVLRFCEDMSEAQTAEALGVSIGTVKSSTSRALAKLRHDSTLRHDATRRAPERELAAAG